MSSVCEAKVQQAPTVTAQQSKIAESTSSDPQHASFLEVEPTVVEAIKELWPSRQAVINYFRALFPSTQWIPKYNLQWLIGDGIAGLTVSLVVVPQAMAYALLADLSPDFGLYTSFAGAATYWLFGTSKDIVIGTTAVGSLLVGEVIFHVHQARPGVYQSYDIAKCLSFMTGLILLAIGSLRMGWMVEVIPYIPVSAFITAASITIMTTQFPVVMGIPNINTREAPYKVIINTLRRLGDTHLDAAIGLSCLVLLDLIRHVCAKMEVRQPHRKRLWAAVSSLRLAFAMLLYILVSWLVNRNLPRGTSRFKIVGHIEKGFKYAGPPVLNADLIKLILPKSPIIIIILVIEHIAIAKNFGKQFGYRINPSQEIMAQGTANILGPFLGGYSCTGSFGASAVLSKASVKTPLAGAFSALILVLALYALTAVFYYIPRAALAGLIVHAVFGLIASPKTIAKYWHLSPFESIIWATGVVVAIFAGLETSIYITIALSLLLLLLRIARTTGQILGKVSIQSSTNLRKEDEQRQAEKEHIISSPDAREIFLPLNRKDASNPAITVSSPQPGVFIYKFPEGLNYLNQALHFKTLSDHVYQQTKRTIEKKSSDRSDDLWCDDTTVASQDTSLPILKAIVLDCSNINSLDITSVQGLVDLRNAFDHWAQPSLVNWHFAGLRNRWARRSLAAAGFGRGATQDLSSIGHWMPVQAFTTSFGGATEADVSLEFKRQQVKNSDEGISVSDQDETCKAENAILTHTRLDDQGKLLPVFATDRPLFHADLVEAVESAVRLASSTTVPAQLPASSSI